MIPVRGEDERTPHYANDTLVNANMLKQAVPAPGG
jgi:hypothetical protein